MTLQVILLHNTTTLIKKITEYYLLTKWNLLPHIFYNRYIYSGEQVFLGQISYILLTTVTNNFTIFTLSNQNHFQTNVSLNVSRVIIKPSKITL